MKSPLLSKTLWTNALLALFAFFPVVNTWVAANPTVMMIAFSVVNIALRLITKDKLQLT